MIRSSITFVLKSGIISLALLIGNIVGAMLIGFSEATVASDGPLTGGQALLVVSCLHGIILTTIATSSHLTGWRLCMLITITLFAAQGVLLLMEAAYFRDSVGLSLSDVSRSGLLVLTTGFLAGIVSALLWRRRNKVNDTNGGMEPLLLKLGLIAGLYVVAYFLAGYFIAWASPEIREYYSDGNNISLAPLICFQILRGLMWGGLAVYIIQSISGSKMSRSLIVGITFSVLATAQLLYPNPVMPWAVRLPHLIEVLVSNLIFGILAAIILQSQMARKQD